MLITEDQSMATALVVLSAPEALLYFTLKFFTSTVNSGSKPTTDMDAALAAMPVHRRVSLATALLAMATLRVAEFVKKPVALVVTTVEVSPEKPAPTPTKRFTPVRSIVSTSALAPAMVAVPRFNTKLPPANT